MKNSGLLARRIFELKKSPLGARVKARLKELENNPDWFSELCFCISTANASSEAGLRFQEKSKGKLHSASSRQIEKWLGESGCRFYRNKAKFIVLARGCFDHASLKQRVCAFKSEREAREWIVKNVKGLGWKEASHFLRNVGFNGVAIIDRHVLNTLKEYGVISDTKLTPKKYLLIERKLEALCKKTGLTQGELDFYLWFLKTGKVHK
ncbi:MAG: N-glycosylase/DNA lyase [Candidatus Norongarragalinales archaeon]